MRIQIIVRPDRDEQGDFEEFTWDMPNIDSDRTLHLDENGLPKIGTRIELGMVLVGKSGKSIHWDRSKFPTSLEKYGLTAAELRERFGHLWVDTPVFAGSEHRGLVVSAQLEGEEGNQRAIVEIEQDS